MKSSGIENDIIRELLRLLEIRRRQMLSAFVTGCMTGICLIELLRILHVVSEPIKWMIGAGIWAPIGVLSLIDVELLVRRALARILGEFPSTQP